MIEYLNNTIHTYLIIYGPYINTNLQNLFALGCFFSDWTPPHSDSHVTHTVGSVEPIETNFRLPEDIDECVFSKYVDVHFSKVSIRSVTYSYVQQNINKLYCLHFDTYYFR